jgi:hypothetical protein
MEEEHNRDEQYLIHCKSIGPMLHEREARDILRGELQPAIASINARIAAGYRVTNIDSVITLDEEGFYLIFDMEKE